MDNSWLLEIFFIYFVVEWLNVGIWGVIPKRHDAGGEHEVDSEVKYQKGHLEEAEHEGKEHGEKEQSVTQKARVP